MKSFIHEMGVLDKNSVIHPVFFQEGLNIVTGKSSTGKSALIEIFDYCFGSSEDTIPIGIITDNAELYYVVLNVSGNIYLLARKADTERAFVFLLKGYEKGSLSPGDFHKQFIPLKNYRKELNKIFLDITDVDESLELRRLRKNNAKAPTPSVRSFVTFMFQHQNLIANKHALFYRFDEKIKREQVINHTKNFLGLVDQDYYLLAQTKETLTNQIKRLERNRDIEIEIYSKKRSQIFPILENIYNFMGIENRKVKAEDLLDYPEKYKKILKDEICLDSLNISIEMNNKLLDQLKGDLKSKQKKLNELNRKSRSLNKLITESEMLSENFADKKDVVKVSIEPISCPFCHKEQESLSKSVIKLQSAIESVSRNVKFFLPKVAEYKVERKNVLEDISTLQKEVNILLGDLKEVENSTPELGLHRSLYEKALVETGRLFNIIDNLTIEIFNEKNEIKELRDQLRKVDGNLKQYNVGRALKKASEKVNKYMKEIGENFEIEESYKNGELFFDFESFDLYFKNYDNDKKIYLRAMGSGANWLYCHLTLFLALHKYFIELGESCSIPTILFLDQPTQVYFPNFKRDTNSSFDDVKEQERSYRLTDNNIRPLEDDISVVTNIFERLAIYCKEIKEEYGYSPQIIVTDHADHLKLNGFSFENFVNGNRWRDRGLINPVLPTDDYSFTSMSYEDSLV